MKRMSQLTLAGLVGSAVVTAWAVPDATVKVERTAGYFSTATGYIGGEFTVKGHGATPLPTAWTAAYSPLARVNGGFQSFSLERNESINGSPWHAYLNTAAVKGGTGGGSPDPISIGTAWLYKQFAQGQLTGYDYTPGPNRIASAQALQEAIWFLEDELTSIGSNPFISLVVSQFGSIANAKTNYSAATAGFHVVALNMYGVNKTTGATVWTAPKADMLMYLPDGGMTFALLGGGLFGLYWIRRKD
ncbi:MAG: hypothetical protein RMN51_03110 [Verrucomicrobiota bacterium]|nr:hypothetical protein [Limisphaera sp.]MDW8381088.1 hypothetical protein [Verrucomicrobiota bacterium]